MEQLRQPYALLDLDFLGWGLAYFISGHDELRGIREAAGLAGTTYGVELSQENTDNRARILEPYTARIGARSVPSKSVLERMTASARSRPRLARQRVASMHARRS